MRHKGQRICIMGGSKSLDSDLQDIKADVWISVNDHGAKRMDVDYIVCMDNIHTGNKMEMWRFLRQYSDAPVISPWHWGQYQILRWPGYPCLFNSGVIASWVAYLMGAHPLIFAGFDCYGKKGRHFEMHKQFVPEVKCEARAVSGPLLDLYPEYRSGERRKAYDVPEIFGPAKAGMIKVRVDKPFRYRDHDWPEGTVLTVAEFEVKLQLKHKSIVRIDDGSTS
jgi:hypothetical protein